MICTNAICLIELTRQQRKFCSRECQRIGNAGNKLTIRSNIKTEDTCKWCMDSKEGFCCDKHKGLYENFRKAIDSEMLRIKNRMPQLTPQKQRAYNRIKDILNKPIDGL